MTKSLSECRRPNYKLINLLAFVWCAQLNLFDQLVKIQCFFLFSHTSNRKGTVNAVLLTLALAAFYHSRTNWIMTIPHLSFCPFHFVANNLLEAPTDGVESAQGRVFFGSFMFVNGVAWQCCGSSVHAAATHTLFETTSLRLSAVLNLSHQMK